MNTFIVLLRGINVGGKNKIKMVDLKFLLSSNGYEDITTYIQSGNISLKSNDSNKDIERNIANLIKEKYDYSIVVLAISAATIINCYDKNPFLETVSDIKTLHVTFLQATPDPTLVEQIYKISHNNDRFIIRDTIIYLHTPDGYGKTVFSNSFFEKQLKIKASTRNWRTLSKLREMALA